MQHGKVVPGLVCFMVLASRLSFIACMEIMNIRMTYFPPIVSFGAQSILLGTRAFDTPLAWLKHSHSYFGVVFLLIGILGFVPAVAPNEMPLNIFHVNAALNVVHLLTGVVALLAGMAGIGAAKTFFKIFGVVYGLVAVLGFVVGDGLLLGLNSNKMADTWLQVVIAIVSLIIGFAPNGESTATAG
jgi:uncharacterized membrane protein HdeD (DUF308 family)